MSREFNLGIADHVINITAIYDSTYDFCRDYITDAPEDFRIVVEQEDLEYERMKSTRESMSNERKQIAYSDPYLETLALYRKIAVQLIDYDVLLFHGSAVAVDGAAYLFTAKSGTGKSTHARLWREYFGKRAVMVNDDKPLLKITDDGVTAYGTPWNGKHRQGSNISVPLKAIAILERDVTNSILRIDQHTAFPILLQQSFSPEDPRTLLKALELVDRLGNQVELFRLKCNMQSEAAEISYYGMNSQRKRQGM